MAEQQGWRWMLNKITPSAGVVHWKTASITIKLKDSDAKSTGGIRNDSFVNE